MQDKVQTKPWDLGTHFDVTKHIQLVPPFQEKEVDKYFCDFTKWLKFKMAKSALLASVERCNWQSS